MGRGIISRFFLEYPLTFYVCTTLFFSYIFLIIFVPKAILFTYFYSHPGQFRVTNWILSSFMHGSIEHLMWNIIFLFILGRAVEDKMGKGRWLLFYCMAGIIAGFGDSFVRGVFTSDNSPTIGASGAISGIASVAALISPYSIKINKRTIPFPNFLVAWTMLYSDFTNLFAKDHIAHWAHIGGFFSVFVTAYFISSEEKEKLKTGFYLNLVFFILTVILLYLIQNR